MSHKTPEDRRREAADRNTAWAQLPLVTKLDRLHRRPGMCTQQRDRLMTPAKKRIAKKAAEHVTEQRSS